MAIEDYQGEDFGGVRSTRYDDIVYVSLDEPCENPTHEALDGKTVRQETRMYMPLDPNPSLRYEVIGTAHRCRGYKFWFWGFHTTQGLFLVGRSGPVGPGAHEFRIVKSPFNTHVWYFVDATQVGTRILQNRMGTKVAVATTTYDDAATAPQHSYTSLMHEQGINGPWYWWDHYDGHEVTGTQYGMCGRWISQTAWSASQRTWC